MNSIEEIKKAHEAIELDLRELEIIMYSDGVNYSNLIHVCRHLTEFWDAHEALEKKVFSELARLDEKIPIRTIDFEHGELRVHWEAIKEARNSGSEFRVKEVLDSHGKALIVKLRKHMEFEDNLIYTLQEDIVSKLNN